MTYSQHQVNHIAPIFERNHPTILDHFGKRFPLKTRVREYANYGWSRNPTPLPVRWESVILLSPLCTMLIESQYDIRRLPVPTPTEQQQRLMVSVYEEWAYNVRVFAGFVGATTLDPRIHNISHLWFLMNGMAYQAALPDLLPSDWVAQSIFDLAEREKPKFDNWYEAVEKPQTSYLYGWLFHLQAVGIIRAIEGKL